MVVYTRIFGFYLNASTNAVDDKVMLPLYIIHIQVFERTIIHSYVQEAALQSQ